MPIDDPVMHLPAAAGRLLSALRGLSAALDGASPDDWRALFALARSHRVSVLLHAALARGGRLDGPPADVLPALTEAVRTATLRSLQQRHALNMIARRLSASNLRFIVLKGAHLAHLVYDQPQLREMVDLDLLVLKDDIRRVVVELERLGFSAVRPYSLEADIEYSQHITPYTRHGVTVELHWRLHLTDEPVETPTASLWARAQTFRLGSVEALGLSVEDLIVHLCVHAAGKHSLTLGLRPMIDVAAILARHPRKVSWRQLALRCDEWRAHRPVALVLSIARHLLDAPMPRRVATALDRFCDTQLLAIGCRRATDPAGPTVPPIYAQLASSDRIGAGLRAAASRYFSRLETAQFYGVSPASPWVPLLFVPRLLRLIGHHGIRGLQWFVTETREKRRAREQHRLRQWLHQPAPSWDTILRWRIS